MTLAVKEMVLYASIHIEGAFDNPSHVYMNKSRKTPNYKQRILSQKNVVSEVEYYQLCKSGFTTQGCDDDLVGIVRGMHDRIIKDPM